MNITTKEVESKDLISMRKKILWENAGEEMGSIYGELMQYMGKNNKQMIAAPICLAHDWNEEGGDVECGLIIDNKLDKTERINSSKTYGGKVAVIEHVGPYKNTSESWGKLFQYVEENSFEKNGTPWEEYITDPQEEKDPSKYITNLYQPIK